MISHVGSRGQSLVEFSLVFPVFVLVVLGIFDGGRLIYAYNTVSNASRDAARVAIVNQSTSGTATCDTTSTSAWYEGCAIASAIALDVTTSDVTVSYLDPTDASEKTLCSPPSIGCIAVVTVQTTYRAITPVIGQLIGDIRVSSTTKMPVERVCTNPNC
jgi:Flp pilus assembly protein TadG